MKTLHIKHKPKPCFSLVCTLYQETVIRPTVLPIHEEEKQKKRRKGVSLNVVWLALFVTVSRFQNWHEKNVISTTARVHQVTTTVTDKRKKKKIVDRKKIA